VAAGENSYENFRLFGTHSFCYGADANLVCEHCACRNGKRLRRTRWLLRKSHSQWRAGKLLSNDSGSSPIAIAPGPAPQPLTLLARGFASVRVDASQFALTTAAPGFGVGILIYHRRRPELLVWMALGVSRCRDCEGWAAQCARKIMPRQGLEDNAHLCNED
jgi:hypothetical protein